MVSLPDTLPTGAPLAPDPAGHPRVTAIVPARNRCAITLRFLEQIGRQTYPHLRVLVVDSHSSDDTVEAIRKAFPMVKVLAAGDNDYWAGATNRGVRHALAAGSEWLLTINDDAVIAEDHVERLLEIAQRNQCQILGAQINHLDEPERIWALGTYTSWGSDNLLRLGHHDFLNGQRNSDQLNQEVLAVDALPGNGVLFHHSVFRRIGLYNDRWLPHYHADSEMVMRAVAEGISAWVTPRLILLNDFNAQQKALPLGNLKGLLWSFGHPRSYMYAPAILFLLSKYCPPSRIIPTLSALLARFLRIREKMSLK